MCPTCAGAVPEDSPWIWANKIYCSETCCRKGAQNG